ncbi:hypothetical protein PRIC1_013502 [Phytophthora ramorum]|uniref:uncharacterized protein n=1 Tax=Phytophthora ramorum TaxID=164328 RepID=UPI0030AB7FA6|nr:hypothetical protein KRP23_8503 [Phytophthora ramorum]KAH7500627.1 hypothetical protein KRP22_9875 [Phytophthora ramorum]
MQMQSCHLFWHNSTLSIVLKRELADCAPSREVPVLHVKRHSLFGGDLEIDLGGSVHPVRMLPVSGKDVRNLRFGLVYGPKRKRVRFRAPDLATYDSWEMVLELAVEKAATERPTFPTWPYPGTSPSLSALEEGYISEEFGFSDGETTSDESKLSEFRHKRAQAMQNPMTGSFEDFIDPPTPKSSSRDDGTESELDRIPSTESEYDSVNRESEVSRTKVLSSDSSNEVDSKAIAHPFATRLRLQLISNPGPETSKFTIGEYFAWLGGEIVHREHIRRKE